MYSPKGRPLRRLPSLVVRSLEPMATITGSEVLAQARAQRRSDDAIWQVAQQDHRLMQELDVARLRNENA